MAAAVDGSLAATTARGEGSHDLAEASLKSSFVVETR